MRRVGLVLLAILLMASLVAICAACGSEGGNDSEATTSSEAVTPSTTATSDAGSATTAPVTETTGAATEQKELAIGVLAGMSGSGSESMSRLVDGLKFAVEYINGKGGITVGTTKYTIKPIIEDYKMTMDGMVAATNKLISSDKVSFAITLCAPPPFTSMASSLVEKNNTSSDAKVLIEHCYAVGQSGGYKAADIPYTFFTYMDWPGTQACLEQFASTYPDVKTVAYISVEDPASHDLGAAYDAVFAAKGVKQVGAEYYETGTTDYYPVLTKLLNAKPDSLLLGLGFPEWQGAIMKQARELGFTGPIVTPGGGSPPDVVLKVAGEKTTDYFSAAAYLDDPGLPADDRDH